MPATIRMAMAVAAAGEATPVAAVAVAATGGAATMTDRPRGAPVAAIAGALFCLVLIYLALQIRAGADPAIGAGHRQAAQPPRKVIVKKVIVRRIVEEGPGLSGARGGGAATSSSGASQPAASAPAPAPAAAPAPAPVVSGAS